VSRGDGRHTRVLFTHTLPPPETHHKTKYKTDLFIFSSVAIAGGETNKDAQCEAKPLPPITTPNRVGTSHSSFFAKLAALCISADALLPVATFTAAPATTAREQNKQLHFEAKPLPPITTPNRVGTSLSNFFVAFPARNRTTATTTATSGLRQRHWQPPVVNKTSSPHPCVAKKTGICVDNLSPCVLGPPPARVFASLFLTLLFCTLKAFAAPTAAISFACPLFNFFTSQGRGLGAPRRHV
jgi:hypothetical protein